MSTSGVLHALLAATTPRVEPNTPQLYVLTGTRAPCIYSSSRLCGPDGTCAETSCRSPRYWGVWLPAEPLPKRYTQPPLAERIAEALRFLGVPLFTDYMDLSSLSTCRPRLGCTSARLGAAASHVSPLYKPRLCIPQLLYTRRLRLARERRIEASWLAMEHAKGWRHLLCLTPRGCLFAAAGAEVEPVEGDVVVVDSRVCSGVWATVSTLLTVAYGLLGEKPEWRNPSVWTPSPLLPLAAAGDWEALELTLWNMSPRRLVAPIRFGYKRVRRAKICSPDGCEELVPEYDTVRLIVRPYGVIVLRVELASIPPLLMPPSRRR